jgi:dCMP deaminase
MKNCLEGGCLRCRNPKAQFPSGTGYDLCICVHAEQNVLLSAARFGIAVEGATIYSTMQPCFGCAKELLQAKIKRIVYLHPWTPSDADPEMDAGKKAEHEKLLAKSDIKHLPLKDPRAKWAVTSLRKKTRRLKGK